MVIGKKHNEIIIDELLKLECFDKTDIKLSYKHVDLRVESVANLNELEMLILKRS